MLLLLFAGQGLKSSSDNITTHGRAGHQTLGIDGLLGGAVSSEAQIPAEVGQNPIDYPIDYPIGTAVGSYLRSLNLCRDLRTGPIRRAMSKMPRLAACTQSRGPRRKRKNNTSIPKNTTPRPTKAVFSEIVFFEKAWNLEPRCCRSGLFRDDPHVDVGEGPDPDLVGGRSPLQAPQLCLPPGPTVVFLSGRLGDFPNECTVLL